MSVRIRSSMVQYGNEMTDVGLCNVKLILSINFDIYCVFFFFFSSRRRHTRSYGDWSSDVCSSDLSSHMLGQIESTLIGIRVVKGANAERFERRRYGKIMAVLQIELLKMARYEAYATPAMETITMLCAGAILLCASYLIFVQHSLDQTSFFMVMACLVGIGESLRRLSKLSSVLGRSNAAAARVFEILDIPTERQQQMLLGEPASAGGAFAPRVLAPIQREIR